MVTPAITASSTSSPRVIRRKASSTAVRGPPLRYSYPLAEATTTGRVARRVSTVGPCSEGAGAPAAQSPAAPVRMTKPLRLIGLIRSPLPSGVLRGSGALGRRPPPRAPACSCDGQASLAERAGSGPGAARPQQQSQGGQRGGRAPLAVEPHAAPLEPRLARAGRTQPRHKRRHRACPALVCGRELRGQEPRLLAHHRRI